MQTSQFGLVPADRDLTIEDGATTSLRDGLRKSPVSYLDFTIDGDRVLSYLAAAAIGMNQACLPA